MLRIHRFAAAQRFARAALYLMWQKLTAVVADCLTFAAGFPRRGSFLTVSAEVGWTRVGGKRFRQERNAREVELTVGANVVRAGTENLMECRARGIPKRTRRRPRPSGVRKCMFDVAESNGDRSRSLDYCRGASPPSTMDV